MGCYVHGIFGSDAFRTFYLQRLGGKGGALQYTHEVDATLDALAAHLERSIDIDRLLEISRQAGVSQQGSR